MSYEVCYMSSRLFLLVALYRTEQDYIKDNPAEIYVITARRYLKRAQQHLELLRKKYKDSKVELVIEKRGKDMAAPIIDKCFNAKEIARPSLW
jgi:mannose-1-phosphate guanylyltransferase